MELDNFHKEILGLCADDDTELWVIIRHASDDFSRPDPVPESVRRKTLNVIRDLLDAGLIEAGFFSWTIGVPENMRPDEAIQFVKDNQNAVEYHPLNLRVDETIQFIEKEWDALGRRPSGGDICSFRATPKGERLAKELGLMES